ncbi:MAG: TetR/AcrR family transcriptional regulator [Pseudomonadota bacterium]
MAVNTKAETKAQTKSQKVQESRSRILQAASELFLDGGMAALSVRAISKRAGLSTIGIYSHFDGKQGILDALYIEGFERVAEAMDVPPDNHSPKQRVLASTRAYLEVADKYRAHYRLIFGEVDEGYQPSAAAQEVAERAFGKLIRGVGGVLPESATLSEKQALALEVWAIVHGYVGLKNHAVAHAVQNVDWNEAALAAVNTRLNAL